MTSIGTPLTHVDNAGPAVLIVGYVLLPLSFIVVLLRLYTKIALTNRRMGFDDLFIGIAFIIQMVYNITFTNGVHWGLGRHLSNLSDVQRENALKWITLSEPFAVLSSMFGRIGFAFYLLNLVAPSDGVQRNLLKVVMVFQFIANVAVVIQILAQCGTHLSAQWDPVAAATATCQSPLVETYFGYVQSSINSVCDLILTILPLLVIKRLQLSTRVKIGLLGLLCLSMFAFVASLIKAVSISNLSVRNNFTYNMAFLVICCTVENNLVIIGASIPTLKPLLKVVTGGSTAQSYGSRTGTRNVINGKSVPGGDIQSNVMITRKMDVTVVHEEYESA
ncbi:hypothetical protein K461DRAFT_318215 [Myriangium duriaei CBS 260.36]|uniref:Rhodopsin domain-containing protein n=1 Tax=Myriangium duriaei CBS 260.36 TaxID=1168546 RepID=A0A9P4JCS3_9PEZI|nr:hypothetical protein K461DRAFT_318215 [Myriangium duriaei CBS 260.36]